MLDHDDELTIDALYEVVKVINKVDVDFIYSDEDKVTVDGVFREPHFKPDYSYVQICFQNYICHLSVIRRRLVEKVGGFEVGLEGSQDHDLFLKIVEQTDRIAHIPQVLYHWRTLPGSTAKDGASKYYAQDAGVRALQNHLSRTGMKAKVDSQGLGTYRVKSDIVDAPLITIIIPFKDETTILNTCIKSIISQTTYANYQIIAISNNSIESDTFTLLDKLENQYKQFSYFEYNVPFYYSQINNYAVNEYAKGDYIVLLNNDIEIISPDWLEAMLGFAQKKEVGAVGAKLYYPND